MFTDLLEGWVILPVPTRYVCEALDYQCMKQAVVGRIDALDHENRPAEVGFLCQDHKHLACVKRLCVLCGEDLNHPSQIREHSCTR